MTEVQWLASTDPLDALLSAIAAGECDACLVLADALEDRGDLPRAQRLRTRYRRWLARREALLARANHWLIEQQQFDELKRKVENAGGTLTYTLECYERGISDGELIQHEDALLAEYTRRLVAEYRD